MATSRARQNPVLCIPDITSKLKISPITIIKNVSQNPDRNNPKMKPTRAMTRVIKNAVRKTLPKFVFSDLTNPSAIFRKIAITNRKIR